MKSEKFTKSSLFKRIVTSLVALPLLILVLYLGGWPLKGGLFTLSVIGMHEFYKALSDKIKLTHYAGYLCAAIYYIMLGQMNQQNALTIILITFTLIVCSITVFCHESISIRDAAVTYFGFCYITVLLSTIYLTAERGGLLVAVVFVSAWGCDTGAFIVGKAIGKKQLAPVLSPKKTVAGAVGGTIFAGVLTAALFIILSVFEYGTVQGLDVLIFLLALAGMICAIFAQLGDLFASAIKRHTGIKDFGTILPGHGGVIDRFDSVLFTAPVMYLLVLTIS